MPFIHLAALVLVLAVNALANILPINGYNTGQISGFYPNYFVPAGFTFGIWAIIYFMLIGFVVIGFFAAYSSHFNSSARKAIELISPFFLITCLLNAGWIVAWHYLFLRISLVIMIAFLVILVLGYLRIKSSKNEYGLTYRIWVYHVFVVYLAWISVATIANFTALFVNMGWQGEPFHPQYWAVALVMIALILGIFFVGKLKEPAYGFVLSWAFFGIYSGQVIASRTVGITAAFAVCFLLSLTFTILIRTRKPA